MSQISFSHCQNMLLKVDMASWALSCGVADIMQEREPQTLMWEFSSRMSKKRMTELMRYVFCRIGLVRNGHLGDGRFSREARKAMDDISMRCLDTFFENDSMYWRA